MDIFDEIAPDKPRDIFDEVSALPAVDAPPATGLDRAARDFYLQNPKGLQIPEEPRESIRPQTLTEKVTTSEPWQKLFGRETALGHRAGALDPLLSNPASMIGPSGALGKAAMVYFGTEYLKSQPERIDAIQKAIASGDTETARHQIMGEIINGALMVAGSKEALTSPTKRFDPPQRETSVQPEKTAPAPKPEPVEPTPELANDLQAAMRGETAESTRLKPEEPAKNTLTPEEQAQINQETDFGGDPARESPPAEPPQEPQPDSSPDEFVTSIKNEQTEVERAQRDMPPAAKVAKRSFGEVWDRAEQVTPEKADSLLAELRQNPRAVTDIEDAVLLRRQVDLQNQYEVESQRLAEDLLSGDPDRINNAKARKADIHEKLFDLYEINKKVGTETGRGLNARKMLANQNYELTHMINEMRTANEGPLTPEQVERVEKVHKKIEETQAKIEQQEQAPPISEDPLPSRDLDRVRLENEKWKKQFNEELVRTRLANQSVPRKALRHAGEAMNLSRSLLTSFDFSAVLRQGGFITLGHPSRAAKSIVPMIKAFGSEQQAFNINREIMMRPNAPLYHRSKLYFAQPDAQLSAMEEAFMSRLAEKIPGVRHSQRAYTTFLNKLRADSFDAMVSTLSQGKKPSQAEIEAIGNYINVATGRGKLGHMEGAATALNTVFFSPRNMASRFQLLAGQPFYHGSPQTRKMIAQEYGRFLSGVAVVYMLGAMAGGTVENDPRSSDFGKVKIGNTRVDPLTGIAQPTVLLSRLGSGETKSNSGKVTPVRGDVPFGRDTGADLIARFGRTKLAPGVGTVVDALSGENVVGEPVTPQSAIANAFTPLVTREIVSVMNEHDIPSATAIQLLNLLGMGVQNYEPRKSSTASSR